MSANSNSPKKTGQKNKISDQKLDEKPWYLLNFEETFDLYDDTLPKKLNENSRDEASMGGSEYSTKVDDKNDNKVTPTPLGFGVSSKSRIARKDPINQNKLKSNYSVPIPVDSKYRERDLIDSLLSLDSKIREKERIIQKNKRSIDNLKLALQKALDHEMSLKSTAADYYNLGRNILEDIETKICDAERAIDAMTDF